MKALVLEYATDGNGFEKLADLASDVRTYSWSVPKENTKNAALRLTATDYAGKVAVSVSSSFIIDSKIPDAPDAALATASVANAKQVQITVKDCSDRDYILVSADSSQPSAGSSDWTKCDTAAGAIRYTLSGEGSFTLRVWAKDVVGQVSTDAKKLSVIYDSTAPSLALTS